MIAENILNELIYSDLSDPEVIARELNTQMMNDYEINQFPSFYFQTSDDPILKRILRGVFRSNYLLPFLVFLAEKKMNLNQRILSWCRASLDFSNSPHGFEEEYGLLEWLENEVMRIFLEGN